MKKNKEDLSSIFTEKCKVDNKIDNKMDDKMDCIEEKKNNEMKKREDLNSFLAKDCEIKDFRGELLMSYYESKLHNNWLKDRNRILHQYGCCFADIKEKIDGWDKCPKCLKFRVLKCEKCEKSYCRSYFDGGVCPNCDFKNEFVNSEQHQKEEIELTKFSESKEFTEFGELTRHIKCSYGCSAVSVIPFDIPHQFHGNLNVCPRCNRFEVFRCNGLNRDKSRCDKYYCRSYFVLGALCPYCSVRLQIKYL
jgi:hypothetical protein